MSREFRPRIIVLASVTLGCTSLCLGRLPPQTPVPGSREGLEQRGTAAAGEQVRGQQLSGSISGTVVDQSGALVAGARVRLTRTGPDAGNGNGEDQSLDHEVLSASDGRFSFANIPPGAFQVTITSADFGTQTFSGVLAAGEIYSVPQIALAVATSITDVEVGLSQTEVAEEQIKIEEKQRVLGVLPNFYVSYIANAVPLSSKQKFNLALKSVVDPFTFVFVGGAAGVEQAQNHFAEYGQGAQGYGKRYGAGYADVVTGTFIGNAILPSLLKQDPRYFYKGSGSKESRILYAIANAFICKGDNRRWQANYSNILGNLAAGGISNLYYPPQDRNGVGLTFENAALGIGATAVSNLLQEFVIRKLTPRVPKDSTKVSNKTSDNDRAKP